MCLFMNFANIVIIAVVKKLNIWNIIHSYVYLAYPLSGKQK